MEAGGGGGCEKIGSKGRGVEGGNGVGRVFRGCLPGVSARYERGDNMSFQVVSSYVVRRRD